MTSHYRYLDAPCPVPERLLDETLVSAGEGACCWVAVAHDLDRYWQPGSTPEALIVIYRIDPALAGGVAAAVVPRDPAALAVLERDDDWAVQLGLSLVPLGGPLRLVPVEIPKPWGREIWYTGVEQRGVAAVAAGASTLPLPWLLATAPQRLCAGRDRDLILLKILDPLPDPVFGDLYFELHEEKREVYVVTHIDPSAWPDGQGAIRFGFDQARIAQYPSRQAFLDDYLAAVQAYRAVRETIDTLLDARRTREGVGLNEPVDAATLRRWQASLPAELTEREATLRADMDRFTALQPLRVGDVVKVPHRVPHSLQHGVRTVEFQTPVYERMILSFAQKVLTQSGWDTAAAAEVLAIDTPPPEPFALAASGTGWREERIVEFDDFEVRRIVLEAGAHWPVGRSTDYRLVMAVGGELQLDAVALGADQAVLLPAALRASQLRNPGDSPCVALLALPR